MNRTSHTDISLFEFIANNYYNKNGTGQTECRHNLFNRYMLVIGSFLWFIDLKYRDMIGCDMRPEVYCGRTRWLAHSPGPPRRGHDILQIFTHNSYDPWTFTGVYNTEAGIFNTNGKRKIDQNNPQRVFCRLMKDTAVYELWKLYTYLCGGKWYFKDVHYEYNGFSMLMSLKLIWMRFVEL